MITVLVARIGMSKHTGGNADPVGGLSRSAHGTPIFKRDGPACDVP